MPKLPWVQFFYREWVMDTQCLSQAEKGCWIDVLCQMWLNGVGSISMSYDQLANLWRMDWWDKAHLMVWQLHQKGVCDIQQMHDKDINHNSRVTLVSRRLLREENDRKNNSKRQEYFRRNAKVTPVSRSRNAIDVRRKTLDVRELQRQKKEYAHVSFSKPKPEDVTAYARSIGFELDGQYFCDRYEANGWKVGRAPMKNWQAAVRTWKKNNYEGGKTNAPNGGASPVSYKALAIEARKRDELQKSRKEAFAGALPAGVRDYSDVQVEYRSDDGKTNTDDGYRRRDGRDRAPLGRIPETDSVEVESNRAEKA